ncbi:conserved hypothetical protein [Candidatus Zixiibacteriota bacterium]|nr:conserved hypothetical protein [candidate division Zixibacteria bacterium]
MDKFINYGDEKLPLNFPENVSLDEFQYSEKHDSFDFKALHHAINEEGNDLFPFRSADLFVVNDAYRHTPTDIILKWFNDNGYLGDRSIFIVATGCHAAPNDMQMRKIFGALYDSLKNRIRVHDAYDRGSMVKIGVDGEGHPVYINRLLHDAGNIVVIGSVEPHYFAGFTGGRKSIFPGLADYDTTVRNHARAVNFEAAPMRLDGNPVADDLSSLMNLVADKMIFSFQIVSIPSGGIVGIFCGAMGKSFEMAAQLAREVFGITAESHYDLILAEVRPPLDSNLYQLQKSLENCQMALRDGGSMVLFSPCHEGIGSESFYNLADIWKSGENHEDAVNDKFGIHKLYRVKKISERIGIYLHSNLPEGVSDKVFFRTVKDSQVLINEISKKGKTIKAALVRDAGQTVLTVRSKSQN